MHIIMKKLVIAPLYYFYTNHRYPFPQKLNLGEGYYLQHLSTSQLNDALEFFHDAFSDHDRDQISNCRYAIYHRYDSENDDTQTPREIINEINRITQAMRIVRTTRVIPAILHFRVQGKKKDVLQISLKPNEIALTESLAGSQHFTKTDSYKLRLYVKRMRELYKVYGGNYQKVLNACIFFEIGHQNYLYKPRIVNFVTCLESLFNTSDSQIGYSLRLRCSLFLERDKRRRMELSRDLKKIYNLRSKIVHGQETPRSILNDAEESKRILIQTETIARRCIQKIFDNDLISIFDSVDKSNIEFEKMEYGMKSQLD